MSETLPVKMRVMENDVFHVAVSEAWQPVSTGAETRPGEASFQHAETGFAFHQSVLLYKDGKPSKAARKAALEEVIKNRMESFGKGGHTLQPGKAGFTEEDWGWLVVTDVILDSKLYGITAAYAFPECLLVHWVNGPTGQEDDVRQAIMKIMATVSYRTGKTA